MRNIRKHFIIGAAKNATEALSLAMYVQSNHGHLTGVQDLIEIINSTAIKLSRLCVNHQYEIESKKNNPADRG